MKKIFFILPLMAILLACSHKTTESASTNSGVAIGYGDNQKSSPTMVPLTTNGIIPKATAFKMSGDYADNVAITIDGNGRIVYYPAPTDLTKASKPVSLGNGWWLNRQGISANSVFTKYTFEEYCKLKTPPTQQELKDAIIPGARVIQMVQLPMSISEASSDLKKAKKYVENLK